MIFPLIDEGSSDRLNAETPKHPGESEWVLLDRCEQSRIDLGRAHDALHSLLVKILGRPDSDQILLQLSASESPQQDFQVKYEHNQEKNLHALRMQRDEHRVDYEWEDFVISLRLLGKMFTFFRSHQGYLYLLQHNSSVWFDEKQVKLRHLDGQIMLDLERTGAHVKSREGVETVLPLSRYLETMRIFVSTLDETRKILEQRMA